MFKKSYKKIYDQISPSEQLVADTIASRRISRKTERYFTPLHRKPVFASVAIMLCLMVSVPVLAATVPAVNNMLYQISPATAQFFKPVQKSDVNSGIKMEVVSAYVHGNVAEIYVTLQDLEENRVDATTDLFDSYSIRRPFNSLATCRLIGFEESTNTAMFLISITEWGNKNITGDKITFIVNEFISDKYICNDMQVALDLSSVSIASNTMPMPNEHGFGGDYDFQNLAIPTVLSHSLPVSFGVEGIYITGMGYIDGMFHIQTFAGNILENDNHGYFYFKDKDGNKILNVYSVGFNEYPNGEMARYNEYVFDIPQSELGQYDLYGNFSVSGIYTSGPWQVTFPLE